MLYTVCRGVQLFTIDVTKGSGKGRTTITKVMPYPIGISTLPESGGMLDQPYRLMEFFEIFLLSERRAVYKNINS